MATTTVEIVTRCAPPGCDTVTGMRVERVIADLPVDDLAAADDFYGGWLGLQREDLGLSWVARYVSESGATLQVVTRDATAPEVPSVSIAVDDVDEAYREAVRRGYEIVHPLTTEAWGVRRFFVRVPDGSILNVLRLRA